MFRIIRAIEVGARQVKSGSKLEANLLLAATKRIEHYAKDFGTTSMKLRTLKLVEGVPYFGKKSAFNVSKRLSMGYTTAIKRVLNLTEVPQQLQLKLTNEVKHLPSFHVGNVERLQATFKEKIKKKLPAETYERLSKPNSRLTDADIANNKVLQDISKSIKNMADKDKKLFPFTGKELIYASIGGTALVAVINKHIENMRGCYVYYFNKSRKLIGCKLKTASCDGKGNFNTVCTHSCIECSQSVLDELPVSMKSLNNCVGVTETCHNCPSSDFFNDQEKKEDIISKLDNISFDLSKTAREDFHFQCNDPSVFDAIIDMTGNTANKLLDVVDQAIMTTSWFLRNLPKLIMAIVVLGSMCLSLFIFLRFFNPVGDPKYKQLKEEEEELKRTGKDFITRINEKPNKMSFEKDSDSDTSKPSMELPASATVTLPTRELTS